MKLQSRLQLVDKHIKRMECVALADANGEGSALLNQLRVLREEIKTKAKKDYVEVQKEVLDSFRNLMEQLATLSFYASEAEKDSRDIEKAISQMNKIKSTISENILGLEEENKEADAPATPNTTASVATASVEDDVRKFVEDFNGKFYTNYAEWYSDALLKNLKLNINRSTVEALDEEGNCLGKYVTDDMNGCLFDNIEDYDKAFEEVNDDDDEEEETEEDEILEGDEESEEKDESKEDEEVEEDEDAIEEDED